MKKFLLLYKILLLSFTAFAQVTIPSGTQWVSTGTVNIVITDMDFINNGSYSAGSSTVKFTGGLNSTIAGTSALTFAVLEIAKNKNGKIVLERNINIGSSVNLTSGFLDLNNNNIVLNSSATLLGESETARTIGANGGYIEISQNMNAPAALNPGNLGATITSTNDLGTVVIRRGHVVQNGTGLGAGIQRYFSIVPQNNTALNATLRFNYFDAEKNGKDENNFVLFQSDDNGATWANRSQTSVSIASNYVEKNGLGSLSEFTLSDNAVVPNCSATGILLTVKAGKQDSVNLNWTTAAETNNQGFGIERRLKNEQDFSQLSFMNSLAAGGNSTNQLSYSYSDNNSYNDTSYYRLKIVGLNASTCYSDIKVFVPKGKKGPGSNNTVNADTVLTSGANKKDVTPNQSMAAAQLVAGPNPNYGNFWFALNGISKETVVTLYTIDGKITKQFRAANSQHQQVSGLRSGLYILKADGIEAIKIIVQNGGGINPPSGNSSSVKN